MDQFDEMRANFEAIGMSPEGARLAAIGRHGSEAAARQACGAAGGQDLSAAQTDATEAAIQAEVAVLGRTRQQAAEHVRSMARDAGARRGAAYAVQLVTEYARALGR